MLQRNRYLLYLMRQYSKATGRKETVIFDPLYREWFKEYEHTLKQLKNHLKSLNINLESVNAYETNKGEADSLLPKPDNRVTKYTLPSSYIEVEGNYPYYKDGDKKNSLLGKNNLIYTFNPYNLSDVDDLYPKLYQIGHPIAIAVAGTNKDVDKESKIEYIEELHNLMPNLITNDMDSQQTNFYSKVIYSRNAINISRGTNESLSFRETQLEKRAQAEKEAMEFGSNLNGTVYGSSLLKYQPKR